MEEQNPAALPQRPAVHAARGHDLKGRRAVRYLQHAPGKGTVEKAQTLGTRRDNPQRPLRGIVDDLAGLAGLDRFPDRLQFGGGELLHELLRRFDELYARKTAVFAKAPDAAVETEHAEINREIAVAERIHLAEGRLAVRPADAGGGRLHISAHEQQIRHTFRDLRKAVLGDVEPVDRLLVTHAGIVVGPGEPVEPVPILQRGISAEDRSRLGPVPVRINEIDLGHRERLAEDARRHEHARRPRCGSERAGLVVQEREAPGVSRQRIRVIPVVVVVDKCERIADLRNRRVLLKVDLGNQPLVAEFVADETAQVADHFDIQVGQIAVEEAAARFEVLLRRQAALLKIRPVAVQIKLFRLAAPVPEGDVLVRERHREKRGVSAPGQPGVRVAVGQQIAHELLPVLPSGGVDRQELLHRVTVAHRGLRQFPVAEAAAAVEIERDVDAALLHAVEQIVEPVELLRQQFGRIAPLPVRQRIVIVVKADRCVAEARQLVGQLFSSRLVEAESRKTEVRAIEPEPFPRRFFRGEMASFVGRDPAVLSGRRVEHAGEIEDRPCDDRLHGFHRRPLLTGIDVIDAFNGFGAGHALGQRGRGKKPAVRAAVFQFQLLQTAGAQREIREVEAVERRVVRGGQRPVRQPSERFLRTELPAGREIEFLNGAVGINGGDGRSGAGTGRVLQQIEPGGLRSSQRQNGRFPRPEPQQGAAFLLRVAEAELHAADGEVAAVRTVPPQQLRHFAAGHFRGRSILQHKRRHRKRRYGNRKLKFRLLHQSGRRSEQQPQ